MRYRLSPARPRRRALPQLAAALAAAGLALTAVACSSSGGGSSPSKSGASGSGSAAVKPVAVKVGVIPIIDVAPIYLGQQKGFYKEEGITVTLVPAQGGAAIIPGVVSGQLQFGFTNITSMLLAESQGVKLKGVANGVASTGKQGADFGAIVVAKGSPITSAKQLEGKKVAVNTLKNIGTTSVSASVAKAGGDPSKVHFVELAFDLMPPALARGQVDAAFTVEPATSAIKAQGGKAIASMFVDTAPDLSVAEYFSSAGYAQKHADVVARFKKATVRSLAYADAHPDEVRGIIASYTKISPSLLKSVTLPRWPAQVNRASVETLNQLDVKYGLYPTAPPVDQVLP